MEFEGTTSQPLGNDILGASMARIETFSRDMKGNMNAMRRDIKGDMDAMWSYMASLISGVIRMKARVDKLYPLKTAQNSNHQVPNSYYQRHHTPQYPIRQIQIHHKYNQMCPP